MNKKRNIILSIVFTIISVIYTVVVKVVDVAAIGPEQSEVGLSTINSWFKGIVNSNLDLYKITEYFGYAILVIVAIYGLMGLIQLIRRKSLFKVDRELICLGVLYALMLIVYVAFDKVAINYRPILIDGVLEPSYPSSHTILSICICVSSLIVGKKYMNTVLQNVTCFITVFLLTMVLLGRTLSGVHWLTDIVGGVIISVTLLMYFYTALNYKERKKTKK